MLQINSKKISLSLCLCAISAVITPALSQADTVIVLAASETGSLAASKAADQKAALAKKAAEREAQKAAESQAPAEEDRSNLLPTREIKMPITEAHILKCYNAYINGETCPYPEGMNATSAEMTMRWLACIFNDQRFNRSFSAMQCRVVLARIHADFDDRRASEVALSIQQDLYLRYTKYGVHQDTHREAIAGYL